MKKLTIIVAVGLALGGCMANMTPEQRASVQARMAEPPPRSISTFLGTPRDRDELIRHGEISTW